MAKRARGVFVVSLMLLAVGAYAVDAVSPGASQAQCRTQSDKLMQVLRDREAEGKHTVWDVNGFYLCLVPPGDILNMADHMKLEDSNNPQPERSGAETRFYNALKAELAKLPAGGKIPQERLLRMALDLSAAPSGTANLQLALLTVHNVIRALARPLTWPAEPAPKDLQYPVFMDLWGRASSDGPVLADVLHEQRIGGRIPKRDYTLERLFDPLAGVFPPLPGIEQATKAGASPTEWNGGSHYYFWLGGMSESVLGSLGTTYGALAEINAKKSGGRGPQGEVEVSNFICGATFGSAARNERNALLAPDPRRPGRCAAPANGQKLILVGTDYEVLNPETKDFVEGHTGQTPTSIWNVAGNAFKFHSNQDNFELKVEWGDMPATLAGFNATELEVRAVLDGPRDAQVAISPVMEMAIWKLALTEGSPGVEHPGVNAYRIKLHGAPTAEEAAVKQGYMRVAIMPIGNNAEIRHGEVIGPNAGKLITHRPGQFDAWFLELQLNGMAKVRWNYVPEGSPWLNPKKK